jgi:hypothetical protein
LLLIVMYEKGTWQLRPGDRFTFGRAPTSTAVLPADRGLSRHAGSFSYQLDTWWVKNESGSSLLYLTGDLGFRVDLPPGMRAPLQQWHIKIRLHGFLDDYTLRLRLPDLDDEPETEAEPAAEPEAEAKADAGPAKRRATAESIVTSTHNRLTLNDDDRLVLAARFEEYLTWRHAGAPAPRSASETAARVGWQSHTVAKRCENIRNRYTLLGVPGLRGPRALEELARLLMSTGLLTAEDLRRLPPKAESG